MVKDRCGVRPADDWDQAWSCRQPDKRTPDRVEYPTAGVPEVLRWPGGAPAPDVSPETTHRELRRPRGFPRRLRRDTARRDSGGAATPRTRPGGPRRRSREAGAAAPHGRWSPRSLKCNMLPPACVWEDRIPTPGSGRVVPGHFAGSALRPCRSWTASGRQAASAGSVRPATP